ncbi:MAG: multiheme c-type cytochrome [Methyloligellaceae bacterium]
MADNQPRSLIQDLKTASEAFKSDQQSRSSVSSGKPKFDRLAQAVAAKRNPEDELLKESLEKYENPNAAKSRKKNPRPEADKEGELSADEQHLQLFVENRYPSANTCGICHPKHYKEWSVSQHAYAQLSPVYLSLNNKINKLSNGSNGDFCLRCHSPVGANLGESPYQSNLTRHPTSREGITCVVCHRIDKAYNKVSGRLALVEGGLTEPVFGPKGNKGVEDVLQDPKKFRVVTDPEKPGRQIHNEAKLFASIQTPTFCGSCHDVTLFNGFRLEEAFSEYRLSPAAAKGVTCQDCHMGKEQGKPSGYEQGPAAVVGGEPTETRKLTSHFFAGPDYSLIHPGIFPHNQKAASFKTLKEWIEFRHEEGWGTDKFENSVSARYKFPQAWASIDDRYEAREILKEQFELLEFAERKRKEVLKNGFQLGDIRVDQSNANGLAFRVQVQNATDGHNVPTGFTGERLVWLEVNVTDRDGKVIFRSGDRDPNGDLKDGHSSYVHAGKMKRDPYLFSLQSIFVTQNGRGGEIEHVIPIPFPTFALPRVLPSTSSLVFTGEPATERNHKKGIEPLGHRWAKYKVQRRALTGKGPYKATVQLKAQAVPINLLLGIQDVGFDFNLKPMELGKRLIAGTQVLWTKDAVFDVHSSATANRSRRQR